MNKNKINIIYGILNLLQIIVLGFSLMIFTSFNENLPWYESCGMQFITIPMFSIPLLLVIGFCLKFLSKKYSINKLNIRIPFYAALSISIPIFVGNLNRILIAIGGFACILFILITIYFVIAHLLKISKNQDTLIL